MKMLTLREFQDGMCQMCNFVLSSKSEMASCSSCTLRSKEALLEVAKINEMGPTFIKFDRFFLS